RNGAPALTGAPFRWLRSAQRQALALPRWTSSFLWGPPGTGKTTTLGVLLAETLDAEPEARVLLLSTTNQAVDLATVAVDKALEKGRRERWREAVRRLGSRFNPALYAGREHLIPNADRVLLARLARAESERPSARDLEALEHWSRRVAELRAELRAASLAVLRASRLAAMTTARAVATLKTLRELADGAAPPFDLIVFDEASQVPLAQALALPALLACWVAAKVAVGITLLVLLARRGRLASPDLGALRAELPFVATIALTNLVSLANYRVGLFVVERVLGLSATGVYSIAVMVAELLWFVSGSLTQAVYGRIGTPDRERAAQTTLRALHLSWLALLAAAPLLWLAAALILPRALGPAYADSLLPLALLLPGVLAF
ncbi:AAA domain-containing protein, partial [Rubrivivax gelatinosus]|uniref:AAA domain-containing protein n=1 Tax=Rubrivivax gelatinosus TaxID=28068 RepID=UPI001ED92213